MGCAVQRTIKPSENRFDAEYKIVSVILNNGETITFDEAGGRYNPKTQTIDGNHVTIKTQDIMFVKISEISTGKSFAAGIAIVALVSSLVFVIWTTIASNSSWSAPRF
jgi:hypothetical protein